MSVMWESRGGWIQINNAVTPYLDRSLPHCTKSPERVVPLLILKHVVQANFIKEPETLEITSHELDIINKLCEQANIAFTFVQGTKLVRMSDVCLCSLDRMSTWDLPTKEPFGGIQMQVDIPTTMNPGVVPTVVTDYQKPEINDAASSVPATKSTSPSSPILIGSSKKESKTSSTISNFQSWKVEGLQCITLYQTRLLCVVKRGIQYLLLADLHQIFFSKWTYKMFVYILLHVLQCPVHELSSDDIGVIQRLSDEQKICKFAVTLTDAHRMLPKVKVFIKRVPHNSPHYLKDKVVRRKKTKKDTLLPRLSLVTTPNTMDTGRVTTSRVQMTGTSQQKSRTSEFTSKTNVKRLNARRTGERITKNRNIHTQLPESRSNNVGNINIQLKNSTPKGEKLNAILQKLRQEKNVSQLVQGDDLFDF